jgi:hypothetical protein
VYKVSHCFSQDSLLARLIFNTNFRSEKVVLKKKATIVSKKGQGSVKNRLHLATPVNLAGIISSHIRSEDLENAPLSCIIVVRLFSSA